MRDRIGLESHDRITMTYEASDYFSFLSSSTPQLATTTYQYSECGSADTAFAPRTKLRSEQTIAKTVCQRNSLPTVLAGSKAVAALQHSKFGVR